MRVLCKSQREREEFGISFWWTVEGISSVLDFNAFHEVIKAPTSHLMSLALPTTIKTETLVVPK